MKTLQIITLLTFAFSIHSVAQNQVSEFSNGTQYGFIENKGQIMDQGNNSNPDVKYLFPGNGVQVHLRQQGFSYEVVKYEEKERRFSEATGWEDGLEGNLQGFENLEGLVEKQPKKYDIHTQRIDIELVGSNPKAQLVALNPAPDYINYYNSITLEDGATRVHHYDKVLYKDIYPNIDLEFSVAATDELTKGEFVKYNFIVHPGGDYKNIKLRYKGADGITLGNSNCDNKKGMDALALTTAHGKLQESIPYSYQLIDGIEQEVKVKYAQLDQNLFGFEPNAKLTPNTSLIIDPILKWGTYYGGSDEDIGSLVTTDANDNVYLAGYALSTSNIASGGHQNTYSGSSDAYLVKFNSNGVRQWATYYGGSEVEDGNSVATDVNGNVYLAGYTYSTSNIAFGGHQDTLGDYISPPKPDAFLVKFNGNGVRQWATYYGGTMSDRGESVATDANGNVYLAGYTNSASNIASSGHQDTIGGNFVGNSDAFLVKFNSNGVRQWATYYGGPDEDIGYSVATDANGNIYMAGETESYDSIAYNGHQNLFAGIGSPAAYSDAFLVKFNSNGVRLWATYYGENANEYASSVATDANGNVYIAGPAAPPINYSIAYGGHQYTHGGGSYDGFLVKFNSSGVRQWATYYGGSNLDFASSVATDTYGNIYLMGSSRSTSGIASIGYQNSFGGGNFDAFLVKFNSNGMRQWATYYGGSVEDRGNTVALDLDDNIYLAGYSLSTSNIAYGGHQDTFGGGTNDAFLVKFWGDKNCNATYTYTDSLNVYTFTNTSSGNNPLTYLWDFGDGTSDTVQNPIHSFAQSGIYNVCLIASDSQGCIDTLCTAITVASNHFCNASYTYTDSVNVYTFTNTSLGNNPLTYFWDFGDGTSDTVRNPTYSFAQPGTYNVCLSVADSLGCSDTLCTAITVAGIDSCSASFTYTVNNNNVTFNNTSTNYTSSFWTFGDNTTSTQQNPSHTYGQNGTYQACLTIIDTSGCTDNICHSILISTGTQLNYCLSGEISKGGANNPAYPASVYLIYNDTALGTLTQVQTTNTGSNGSYEFCNVPVGKYLVKAALDQGATDYNNYVPTYYGNSLFWSYAIPVLLTQNLQQIDTWLIGANNPGGPGFVGGFVSQGANKMQGPGDPVEDVPVLLLDMFDNPVQYTYSDADGKFTFSNVAYGTYKVYAEVLGKPTDPVIVTVSEENKTVEDLALIIESTQVISSVKSSGTNISSIKVYPNPVYDLVMIDLTLERFEKLHMTISDITGKTIIEDALEGNVGSQIIQFDLSQFPQGVYLMRITNGDDARSFKLEKF